MNIKQDKYVNHAELCAILQQMATEYPDLVDLEIAGRSREDREIWAVSLTNKKTGAADTKPAMLVTACIHGGEITGTQVTLYLMNYILNHQNDAEIKRLLDKRTLYILPRTNPDGAERFVMTEWECWGTSVIFPFEKYPEGLERCDVDGNGKLLMMRQKNINGEWKISKKDPRLMIPRLPYEFDGEYYSIYPEGELVGEKVDVNAFKVLPKRMQTNMNRNYPDGWDIATGVSEGGDYPFSEPETHAVGTFVMNHKNISFLQDLHTNGGVLLRPYSYQGDEFFPAKDLELYNRFGEVAKEYTGYDLVGVFDAFTAGTSVRRGCMDDWAYEALGIIGMTTELWNMSEMAGVQRAPGNYYPDQYHTEDEEIVMLKWNDNHLDGKHFINWKPFNHPQLGEIEIGGWDWKWTSKNPPIKFLEQECHKVSMMCIKQAAMLPEIEVSNHSIEQVAQDVYRVKLTVENAGYMPTYAAERALENKVATEIEVVLDQDDNFQLLAGRYGSFVGNLEGRFRFERNVYFGDPGEGVPVQAKTLEWLIKTEKKDLALHFHVNSDKAGKVEYTINF